MPSALAVLLAFLLALEGTGFTWSPPNDLGAPVTVEGEAPFTFTVESAAAIEGGYESLFPAVGWQLVAVEITTTNTGPADLGLYDWFYALHWGFSYLEWDYCYLALNDEMAPLAHSLPPGLSVTWRYVYEVPADAKSLFISHTVWSENELGEREETVRHPAFFPLEEDG